MSYVSTLLFVDVDTHNRSSLYLANTMEDFAFSQIEKLYQLQAPTCRR